MGLRAYIYRSSLGDCSNGGLSGRVDQVTVVNVEGPFTPTEDAPAVELVNGNVPKAAKIVPVDQPEGCAGPMMGGTYVETSDSRFARAVEKITGSPASAVPFHDRFETWRENRILSN